MFGNHGPGAAMRDGAEERGQYRGGGVMQTRISAIQILYEIFVRNLFGVFKDLCRYTLVIAFAT